MRGRESGQCQLSQKRHKKRRPIALAYIIIFIFITVYSLPLPLPLLLNPHLPRVSLCSNPGSDTQLALPHSAQILWSTPQVIFHFDSESHAPPHLCILGRFLDHPEYEPGFFLHQELRPLRVHGVIQSSGEQRFAQEPQPQATHG